MGFNSAFKGLIKVKVKQSVTGPVWPREFQKV
jgi:hypothetical protein